METLETLIVVKAYPNPSVSLTEAVCMLGITKEHGFVRLYPVPFRDLSGNQQFSKYQLVKMRVNDPKSDGRANTFRPDSDSFEVLEAPLSTKNKWAARKEWVMPLVSESMCEIQRKQEKDGTSMGVFKPAEVYDVLQDEEEQKEWSDSDLSKLQQQDLFRPNEKPLLEKLPYRWRYHYRCSDPDCKGHKQKIIDWEIGALYRNLKNNGVTDPDEIHAAVRKRFLDELCGPDKDTYFFTGNMARYPQNFLVLGVFYPKIERQMTLF